MTRPHTLFGRLLLILFGALVLAQALTFALVLAERSQAMRGMMVSYLTADVASSIAMLDRLPADERNAWLPRLQRASYQLSLAKAGPDASPARVDSSWAEPVIHSLSQALTQPVWAAAVESPGIALRLQTRLLDGTAVNIDLAQPRMVLSPWLVAALVLQFVLLAGVCWLAVRHVTRPLERLASAASTLDPARVNAPLPETGPSEVAHASAAFNQMHRRIAEHLKERSQMLGAISHDLQTPITRMRLRADLLLEEPVRGKFHADLEQMQHLVEQGLAYAQTSQAVQEAPVATDLNALLQSIVADYQDLDGNEERVRWIDGPATTLRTRPRALRRMVGNLIDNALKFAGSAEVALLMRDGTTEIQVLDRGPGIPEAELHQVLRPFYRIDNSRNEATGGTGLGLAITQSLAPHCGAELRLEARAGGGLAAHIRFQPPAL